MIEPLESRVMLTTWGAFPTLTGQAAAAAAHPTVTGAGYAIAVLDTGVDYMHPSLGGGFGPGFKVEAGWDFVDNDPDPMDTDGHGTGTASAAAALPFTYGGAEYQGAAPGAHLIALRTDDGTFGWNKEAPYIEQALQWVIANASTYNIVSVNISNGKSHYSAETALAPCSDEFATLASMGIVITSSSGNDGVQVPYGVEYPGADPNVYAIGSINSSDVISTFTERGALMDLLAPGENVPLPYWLSPLANPSASNRHIYLAATGTSFASPYVAGAVALIKQVDPSLTGQEIISILSRSGVANYDGDHEAAPVTGLTWPRVSISAAINMAYAERDDNREENDILSAASALTFTNDTASASGLKLLLSDADFYKFTLSTDSDVDFAISSNGSFTPTWDLLDSGGTLLKHLSSSDAVRLSAGTYNLRVNAPAATLDGDYSINIDRTPDDALNNHSTATATPITLSGGSGGVSNLNMLAGLDDYFSFTLAGTNDVDLGINFAGSTPDPGAQLLDTNGNLIANYSSGALSRRLTAGRYLIRVYSAVTLDSTYSVSVDATPYVAPPVVVPGTNGTGNGIAYDSTGKLHFAWFDESTGTLKYAVRSAANVWGAVQTIDANPLTGQFVSLSLDPQGRPGVAYLDSYNADLKYAHWTGSAWSVQLVDSNKITGYYPSLKYDAAGRPVISYYYKTGGDLRVAVGDTSTGANWTITAIDTGNDVGRYSSLALNLATGRWATAYEDTTTGHFKYAEQGKSAWALYMADSTTKYGGGFISLAFSPITHRPAMSYYDAFNADLKYATFNGSTWSPRAVATKGSVGLYSNLLIDPGNGAADILYYSKTSDAVMHAGSNAAGSTWAFSTTATAAGRWISRAVDDSDNQTIALLKGSDLEIVDL